VDHLSDIGGGELLDPLVDARDRVHLILLGHRGHILGEELLRTKVRLSDELRRRDVQVINRALLRTHGSTTSLNFGRLLMARKEPTRGRGVQLLVAVLEGRGRRWQALPTVALLPRHGRELTVGVWLEVLLALPGLLEGFLLLFVAEVGWHPLVGVTPRSVVREDSLGSRLLVWKLRVIASVQALARSLVVETRLRGLLDR